MKKKERSATDPAGISKKLSKEAAKKVKGGLKGMSLLTGCWIGIGSTGTGSSYCCKGDGFGGVKGKRR